MAEGERPAFSRVFISYRREDSAGFVRALLGPLRERFGTDRIFKDTDNIPPGQDFLNVIEHELTSCKVLLAVIGNEWMTVTDVRTKKHRLDNPADTLRVEIAAALRNAQITVIPVLVDHAVMPAAEDLPEDLRPIARRNAFELSDSRWDSDVGRLIEAIEHICVDPAQASVASGALEPGEAAPPLPDANAPDFVERLAVKRKRQVADHVKAAKEAWEARDLPGVLAACERAMWLDPQDPDARDLAARAQTAIDEQEIQTQLNAAQAALGKGELGAASEAIDQVLARRPNHQAAIKLRQDLLTIRGERERQRETDRLVTLALREAQTSLDEEDFTAALSHVDDALALAAESQDAIALRAKIAAARDESVRRRELKRRAQQTVTDAQAEFTAGQHDAALARLSAFSPPHEMVSQALVELQRKAVEARDAAQREQLARDAVEAAARARHDADAALGKAAAAIQQRQFTAALELVEAARALDGAHPDLVSWTTKIESAIAEEAAAERNRAEQHAQAAREEAARAAAEERARRERADKLERENARQRDEARRLEQALAGKLNQATRTDDHDVALAVLKEALDLSPADSRVRAAIAERQAARQRVQAAREQQRLDEAQRQRDAHRREEEHREEEAARASLERQNLTSPQQESPALTTVRERERPTAAPGWVKYAAAAAAVVVAIIIATQLWSGGSGEDPPASNPVATAPGLTPQPAPPQVNTQPQASQAGTPTARATTPPAPQASVSSRENGSRGASPSGSSRGRATGGASTGEARGERATGPAQAERPAELPINTAPSEPLRPVTQGAAPTEGPRAEPPSGPAQSSTARGSTASSTTPVDPQREARAAIQNLVDRYVAAYSMLDERRIRDIVPRFRGIPGRSLLESVRLTLPQVQIDITPDGQSASLKATGTFAYIWKPSRGATLPPVSPAELTWKLQKQGTAWVVTSAN